MSEAHVVFSLQLRDCTVPFTLPEGRRSPCIQLNCRLSGISHVPYVHSGCMVLPPSLLSTQQVSHLPLLLLLCTCARCSCSELVRLRTCHRVAHHLQQHTDSAYVDHRNAPGAHLFFSIAVAGLFRTYISTLEALICAATASARFIAQGALLGFWSPGRYLPRRQRHQRLLEACH
jgi:hypothetical protein